MLESLRLIDFKSFIDETIPFSPVTFLVGANAAGKSNVLDALRFLHGLSYGLRLGEVLDGEEGRAPDAWRGIRGGARESARYGIESFALRSTWSGMGAHRIKCEVRPIRLLEEQLVSIEGRDLLRVDRDELGKLTRLANPMSTSLASANSDEWDTGASVLDGPANEWLYLDPARIPAEALLAAMRRIRFVDIEPNRMRDLSHNGPPLRDDGANLSGVLHALCRDPDTRKTFIEWVAELCAPELTDFDFIEVEELGDVMVVLVERDGRRISARSMSDGTLRFLGILTALYTAEADSILCFEELGAGLHPARVRLLLDLLETAHRERGIQTIVTTHSPSLLRWLPDERLGQAVLLARTPDHPGTIARRLGDLPGFFDAVRTLGLEEMFGTQWLEAAL